MRELQKLIDGLTYQEKIVLLSLTMLDLEKEISKGQESVRTNLAKLEKIREQMWNIKK